MIVWPTGNDFICWDRGHLSMVLACLSPSINFALSRHLFIWKACTWVKSIKLGSVNIQSPWRCLKLHQGVSPARHPSLTTTFPSSETFENITLILEYEISPPWPQTSSLAPKIEACCRTGGFGPPHFGGFRRKKDDCWSACNYKTTPGQGAKKGSNHSGYTAGFPPTSFVSGATYTTGPVLTSFLIFRFCQN